MHAIKPIRALQQRLERELAQAVKGFETEVLARLAVPGADGERRLIDASTPTEKENLVALITNFTVQQGQSVNSAWRDLLPYLIAHFRDGYILDTDGKDARLVNCLTDSFFQGRLSA